jgi:UDP-N-acetylmuramoyl-tripeptide--D-alanyl-D-alanine ligase
VKSIFKKIVVEILTWEAKIVLKKYNPKIIAVTGSVGKTSTKDAIFTVLSSFLFVRKSEKSFNSEFGVPLTILGVPNGWNNPFIWFKNMFEGLALIVLPNLYPKWLILEIGADAPGDILSVASWIRPDITVVTRLSKVPVHVEFFSTPEDIFKEKGYLVSALKRDGILIINSDDDDVLAFRSLVDNKSILFGTSGPAEVVGADFHIIYKEVGGMIEPNGIAFNVSHDMEHDEIVIAGGLGVQQMYPALAAIAVGIALSLPLDKIANSFVHHHTSRGRMRILKGIKRSTIIDDSYNSSPVALEEALNTLKSIETSDRKIAVLGDMLELGIYSTEEHKKAGAQVAFVDLLFTVGIRARGIAEGALDAGMSETKIFQYESSREAGIDLEIMMREGDVVLIKGSQGVRMERVVEEVMAESEHKERLLVRQDKEWLVK